MYLTPWLSGLALAVFTLGAHGEEPIAYFANNGKWYQAVLTEDQGITWNDAHDYATQQGGYLAAPRSEAENNFVFDLVSDPKFWTGVSVANDILGPWLGIYSTMEFEENFVYSGLGDPLGSFQPWFPRQPDNFGGAYQAAQFYAGRTIGSTWGDNAAQGAAGYPLARGFVVQFDHDPAVQAAPEPASLAMMACGIIGLAAVARRRASARAEKHSEGEVFAASSLSASCKGSK